MEITKAIADLRQQVHDDLRRQHPEWVLPNGESPMCDAYETRLMDLIENPERELEQEKTQSDDHT
jgi:hypothetical protein